MNLLGGCQVWCWRGSDVPAAADAVVSSFERERASRFLHPADSVRSVTAAALVRLVVADWAGAGPESSRRAAVARELDVDRTCAVCGAQHGPPRVVGAPYLSVTHTGCGADSLVLVAATRLGVVGIDAEAVTDLDFSPLLPTVLAPEEIAVGTPDTQRDWFAVWACKEAVLKATGDGLRTPMSEVVLGPGPVLKSYCGTPRRGVLRALDLGSDVAAAVAVLNTDELQVRMIDARKVLD